MITRSLARIINFTLISVLVACSSTQPQAPKEQPQSTSSFEFSHCKSQMPSYLIQSEGTGASELEASNNARASIAQQIKVNVEVTELSLSLKKQTDTTSLFSSNINTNSDITLTNSKVYCAEQQGDVFKVVVGYDNRDLSTKLESAFKQQSITHLSQLVGPKLLLRSHPFTRSTLSQIDSPDLSRFKVSLSHNNNMWNLNVANVQISLSANDLGKLIALNNFGTLTFVNLQNSQYKANTLNNGDVFKIKYSQLESDYQFISIFIQQKDGSISKFTTNTRLYRGEYSSDELQACMKFDAIGGCQSIPHEISKDKFIAIASTRPIKQFNIDDMNFNYTVNKAVNPYALPELLAYLSQDETEAVITIANLHVRPITH